MLTISESQLGALQHSAEDAFVQALCQGVRHSFPECFGLAEDRDVEAHVMSRMDLARKLGIVDQCDIASLICCELQVGVDIVSLPPEHWMRGILESDGDGASRVARLEAQVHHLEIEDGFLGEVTTDAG